MVSQTNEQALEAAIERKLTGTTREAIKEQIEWASLGDQLISSDEAQAVASGAAD